MKRCYTTPCLASLESAIISLNKLRDLKELIEETVSKQQKSMVQSLLPARPLLISMADSSAGRTPDTGSAEQQRTGFTELDRPMDCLSQLNK